MVRFKIKDRKLGERANLAFEFPQSNGRFLRVSLPFLENPTISEKGRANMSDYSLIGRAGQLFGYAGSDSRKFNMTFNISLMHVIETDQKEGISDKFKRNFMLYFNDKASQEKLFGLKRQAKSLESRLQALEEDEESSIEDITATVQDLDNIEADIQEQIGDPDIDKAVGYNHSRAQRNFYAQLLGAVVGHPDAVIAADAVADIANFFGADITGEDILESLGLETTEGALQRLDNTINLVMFWLNLVRSSVLNNSRNTTYGPPIIRLNHGTMYNNVPCLVEDYDIKIVEEAGYEINTLTPKRLQITLSMIESRTGNFGNYVPGAWQLGDNVTGWESVISDNAIDPHNGETGGLI